jgi:hypothetical protein
MAIVVASGSAVSVAANTKSSDQVSGTYQFIQKGKITLVAKSSATGINLQLVVGGQPLVNDAANPFTGTAGTISSNDNVICSQVVNGGRVEFYLRNTTGGAVTTDYTIYWDPM